MCVLLLLFDCVAICSSHLEESTASESQIINDLCAEEECPMMDTTTSTLPERPVVAPPMIGSGSLVTQLPIFSLRLTARQPLIRPPHSPPFLRLAALRI